MSRLRVDRFGNEQYVPSQWSREDSRARRDKERLEDYASKVYSRLRTASIAQLQELLAAGVASGVSREIENLARAAQDEIIRRNQEPKP